MVAAADLVILLVLLLVQTAAWVLAELAVVRVHPWHQEEVVVVVRPWQREELEVVEQPWQREELGVVEQPCRREVVVVVVLLLQAVLEVVQAGLDSLVLPGAWAAAAHSYRVVEAAAGYAHLLLRTASGTVAWPHG